MAGLAAFVRLIDRLNDAVGRGVAWLTLAMVLITFAVVLLRYVFAIGWVGMQESYVWLHGIVFMQAAAYAETIDASIFVGPNGVQILGGHGFMQDYPVEKYMREARALGLALGGLDVAREEAGRAVCEAPARVDLSYVEVS